DLSVTEPTGSLANALQRQTIGGGTLLADSMTANEESYVASEAFSGDYLISIERVWGRPLGGKAQLKIIRHQGTPQETEELITVRLASTVGGPFRFSLDKGRRTEAAYVPPAAVHQAHSDSTSPLESQDSVLNRIRVLSDPEITGVERGMRGATTSA